jgi:hypothetical protein
MKASSFLRLTSIAIITCIYNSAAASDWESAPPEAFSEIVHFQSGIAYISGDVVVIRRQDGTLLSNSFCEDVGSYDKIVAIDGIGAAFGFNTWAGRSYDQLASVH